MVSALAMAVWVGERHGGSRFVDFMRHELANRADIPASRRPVGKGSPVTLKVAEDLQGSSDKTN